MTLRESFKTPGGTELPIFHLRGKEYLLVQWRIVWFREEKPLWTIETEYLTLTDKLAIAKATIRNEDSRIISMSHKQESPQGFSDYIEKAETGAIGRALALIGYGTQFCADDFDESHRIVDSPVVAKPVQVVPPVEPVKPQPPRALLGVNKGKALCDLSFDELRVAMKVLEAEIASNGKTVSTVAPAWRTYYTELGKEMEGRSK